MLSRGRNKYYEMPFGGAQNDIEQDEYYDVTMMLLRISDSKRLKRFEMYAWRRNYICICIYVYIYI